MTKSRTQCASRGSRCTAKAEMRETVDEMTFYLALKSRPIQKIKDMEKFNVDVTGVKQLELFADCPSTWGAHSVWIDPQLLAAAPAKTAKRSLRKLIIAKYNQ